MPAVAAEAVFKKERRLAFVIVFVTAMGSKLVGKVERFGWGNRLSVSRRKSTPASRTIQ